MKELTARKLTISPIFNLGFGYMKSDTILTGVVEFKSKIFLVPFFAFTYTECYQY